MKPSTLASGSQSLICPICEAGELSSNDHQNGVRCPVWLRAESQCLGNAPADNLPAGLPDGGIPLSGLPFGGPTRKGRIPRGSRQHEQRSSPIKWRKFRRTASTGETQQEARYASAGRR